MFSFASLFGGNCLNIAVLSDFGSGDKNKVEKLRTSQLLKAEHIFTTSDFTGKNESDVEDLFDVGVFVDLVNKAYGLKGSDLLKTANVIPADNKPYRLIKVIENHFMGLTGDIPVFSHYAPADWLISNPKFLENSSAGMKATLDNFEKVFSAFNGLLPE